MKGKLYRTAIVIVALVAFFMSIPLLAKTYRYLTWQDQAKVILKDGSDISGSIKYHSYRCENYEITNENGIHIVSKDSVRELIIKLDIYR